MYQVEQCRFTPYHPILRNDKTFFPLELGNPIYYDGKVYNLVLYNRGLIKISHVDFAASLNHNFQIGCLKHKYFGTDTIRLDLLASSNKFEIHLESSDFVRDVEDNTIIGLDINAIRKRNLFSSAISITERGRMMIRLANKIITENFGAILLYQDDESGFIDFEDTEYTKKLKMIENGECNNDIKSDTDDRTEDKCVVVNIEQEQNIKIKRIEWIDIYKNKDEIV